VINEQLSLGYWVSLGADALFFSLLHSLEGAHVTVLPFGASLAVMPLCFTLARLVFRRFPRGSLGVRPPHFSLASSVVHPQFILSSPGLLPGFLSRFALGSSPFLLLSRGHSLFLFMGVDIAFSQAFFMGIYIPFSSVRKLYPTARDSLFPVAGESFLGSGLALPCGVLGWVAR